MPPDLSSPFPTCPDKKKEKKEIVECREICKDNSQTAFRLSYISLVWGFFGKSFLKSSGGRIKFDQVKYTL